MTSLENTELVYPEKRSNRLPGVIIVLVLLLLLSGACSAGFIVGRTINPASGGAFGQWSFLRATPAQSGTSGATPIAGITIDRETLFKPFWQAWDIVHEKYVDQPVDDIALMRGAISGMLKALGDEHTSYLDPDMTKQFEAHLNGQEYEGIGAWIDISGDYLTIISPMPGSPAEKAGLQPGDKVIAVDGEDMTGIDGELVRKHVIGPKGSKVLLTIRREGVEETIDVEVTRDTIAVPTVDGKMIDDIAYVRLYTFGDDTEDELRKTLKELLAEKPAGIVLDLRYNGGGYLHTAIDVVSEFIGDGVVMYEEQGDGSRESFKAKSGGIATKIPMVVLVNEGSASASEIVAGAIQDRGRGQLVGTTTFGKGSVQVVENLLDDQGQVRITIARWLTPDGRQISKVGLEPDLIVEVTDEDLKAGRDTQLDKAIELLWSIINRQ